MKSFRTEGATASGAGRRPHAAFPSSEMLSVPARHRIEPNLKPVICAVLHRCSLWVSLHAPSFGNRLQTHRGGARQNQLAAAMLLLAPPESEWKRQSREGGSTKGFFGYMVTVPELFK